LFFVDFFHFFEHFEPFFFLFNQRLPLAIHRKWKLRKVATNEVDRMKESEVPALPSAVNQVLYWISKAGLLISRWMPFGTTLALVGVKKGARA
jgi:hypothetical protein